MSPLGPEGVASFGLIPWVLRMCRAAGLKRNLKQKHKGFFFFALPIDANTTFFCPMAGYLSTEESLRMSG